MHSAPTPSHWMEPNQQYMHVYVYVYILYIYSCLVLYSTCTISAAGGHSHNTHTAIGLPSQWPGTHHFMGAWYIKLVNLVLNTHNINPIAGLWGWAMGCILWVLRLIYVLSLRCCMLTKEWEFQYKDVSFKFKNPHHLDKMVSPLSQGVISISKYAFPA